MMTSRKMFFLFLITVAPFFCCDAFGQEFATRKILSDKIEMLLPLEFRKMDSITLNVKYPAGRNRPSEVYTNANASVNIAFTHSSNRSSASEIKKYEDQFLNILTQKAGVQLISKERKVINGNEFLIVSFYSSALNAKIYNRMFITVLLGRILLGAFNCVVTAEELWKGKLELMLYSIRFR